MNEQDRNAKVALHDEGVEAKTARQESEAAILIEEICSPDDPEATERVTAWLPPRPLQGLTEPSRSPRP